MYNDSSGPSRPTDLQIEEARAVIEHIVDRFLHLNYRLGYDAERLHYVLCTMLKARMLLNASVAPERAAPHVDPREVDCFLLLYWLVLGKSISVLRRRAQQVSSRRGRPIDDEVADRLAGDARDKGYTALQDQYNGKPGGFRFDPEKQDLTRWVSLLVGNGVWRDGGLGGVVGEFLRREARHPEDSWDHDDGPSLDIEAADNLSPEEAAEQKQRLAPALARLRQRPFEQRISISAYLVVKSEAQSLAVVDTIFAGAFAASEQKRARRALIDILKAYERAQQSCLQDKTIFYAAAGHVHTTSGTVRRWLNAYLKDVNGEDDSVEIA